MRNGDDCIPFPTTSCSDSKQWNRLHPRKKSRRCYLSKQQGRPHEIIGDLVVVQNNYTLGLTEENILSSLRSYSTKLIVQEKSTRSHIKAEENPIIKDKVVESFRHF